MRATEWEKIFANDISNKRLVSKTHQELTPLNTTKKQIIQLKNEQTLLQRRYPNDQQTHEKMLNITDLQGNANQNYNEIPPHTCQNT